MSVEEILNYCETALKHHEKTLDKFKANHDGSAETDKIIEYQIGRIISYRDIIDNIQFDCNLPLGLNKCNHDTTSKDIIEQAMCLINEDENLTTRVKSIAFKKLREIRKMIVYSNNDGE